MEEFKEEINQLYCTFGELIAKFSVYDFLLSNLMHTLNISVKSRSGYVSFNTRYQACKKAMNNSNSIYSKSLRDNQKKVLIAFKELQDQRNKYAHSVAYITTEMTITSDINDGIFLASVGGNSISKFNVKEMRSFIVKINNFINTQIDLNTKFQNELLIHKTKDDKMVKKLKEAVAKGKFYSSEIDEF